MREPPTYNELLAKVAALTAEIEHWKNEALCLGEFAATYNRDSELQNLMASNNGLLARAEAMRTALEDEQAAIADYLRYIASIYAEGSDSRNTFVLAAAWVEARKERAALSAKGEG